MKSYYSYLSRKQIIIVWTDENGVHSTTRQRNDAGEASAARKRGKLEANGYTRVNAPSDWFEDLLDRVRAAQTCK